MHQIRGVTLLDLEVFHDSRGDLVAIDEPSNLPFPLRRVFYMKVGHTTTTRANHATSSDLMITPVAGAVTVDLDNGHEQLSVRLATPDRGLWTRPGIFISLRDFAKETVLLFCASVHVRDTRYFRAPQPELIEAHAFT